jgi:hypothetical protein
LRPLLAPASIGGLRIPRLFQIDRLRVGFDRGGAEPTLVSEADGVGASNRDRTGDLQGHNLAL